MRACVRAKGLIGLIRHDPSLPYALTESKRLKSVGMTGWSDLELHRLDCLSSNGNLENYELARGKLQEFPEERLRPDPLVTGTDLIGEGYEPGPQFSKILAAVEDAQLEDRIHTAGEAMELVRELFPR